MNCSIESFLRSSIDKKDSVCTEVRYRLILELRRHGEVRRAAARRAKTRASLARGQFDLSAAQGACAARPAAAKRRH